MNAHYSEQLRQAVVVSPTDLKKLIELLQKRIGEVNIRVSCVDKVGREFDTIDSLTAYENFKSKRIRSLYLNSQTVDDSKSATIVFGNHSRFDTKVSVSITGYEDVVLRLKEEVLDLLSGMRPWYSWIASVKRTTMFYTAMVIPWIIFIIAIFFEWIPVSDSGLSDSTKKKIYIIVFLVGLLCMLGIWTLRYLRRLLFPRVVFTIGQGESQFKLLERIRWGVVISFGVSLAAGILLLIFK